MSRASRDKAGPGLRTLGSTPRCSRRPSGPGCARPGRAVPISSPSMERPRAAVLQRPRPSDAGNHRALERRSSRRAARRGGLINPPLPASVAIKPTKPHYAKGHDLKIFGVVARHGERIAKSRVAIGGKHASNIIERWRAKSQGAASPKNHIALGRVRRIETIIESLNAL